MSYSQNRSRFPSRGLAGLAVGSAMLLALAAPASADPASTATRALGTDGTLYQIHAGLYGDLFPGGSAADPAFGVLALDIDRGPDGVARELVPSTESWRPDLEPRLDYDADADAVVLHWRSLSASGSSSLFFTSFAADGFGPVDQLRSGGSVVFFDEAPRVAIDGDRYALGVDTDGDGQDDQDLVVSRRTLHVAWRQASGDVRYAPVLFVDGHFVGWSDSVSLSALVQSGHAGEAPLPTGSALDVLDLRPAPGGGQLVTFTDATFGRLATVATGVLPLRLEALGVDLRERIFAAADLYDPGDLSQFAHKIRSEIIHIGGKSKLNAAVTHYLSIDLADWILTNGADWGYDLEGLANAARSRAMHVGSAVYATTVNDPDGVATLHLDLSDFLDPGGARDELLSVLTADVQSDIALPSLPDGLATPSVHGAVRTTALAWELDGSLVWIESSESDGWSAPRSVALSDSFDRAAAVELLEKRLD